MKVLNGFVLVQDIKRPSTDKDALFPDEHIQTKEVVVMATHYIPSSCQCVEKGARVLVLNNAGVRAVIEGQVCSLVRDTELLAVL